MFLSLDTPNIAVFKKSMQPCTLKNDKRHTSEAGLAFNILYELSKFNLDVAIYLQHI